MKPGMVREERYGYARAGASLGLAALVALSLGACASTPSEDDPEARAAYEEANDPLEPLNRGIFEFNRHFDAFVLKPAAIGYRKMVPAFFRERVHTVLQTAESPVVFANDLLQGKLGRAGVTLGRFVVNATLGLGGLFDMASEMGLEYHDEDFGQTLAVWGADEGPYLMIPVLGPTNVRDGVGRVVDIFLDPATYIFADANTQKVLYARMGAIALDVRERHIETIENLEETSIDFYSTIRSLYRQHRDDAIRDGDMPPLPPVPGVGTDGFSDIGPIESPEGGSETAQASAND